MRVKIHRGAVQVGGTCVELESRGARILLDLGMPLDAEEGEVPLPNVAGLAGGDPSLLGVFITHLHGDHCGLVPFLAPGVPVAMGAASERILREAEFFTGRPSMPSPRWPLVDRVPVEIGPFRITPWQVEHSAFDAFALLVEADGKRLFYTGDFRAHGNDRGPFDRLVGADLPQINALLMEGTQVGGGREGAGPSEADLEVTLTTRLLEWPGMVLVAWSAQNLDRLRTLHQAAVKAGRTLVVDLYAATLAKAAASPELPVPGTDGLAVYCRRRERIQVKEARSFGRVASIHDWRIFPEELAARASRLVMVLRPSMVAELERAGALKNALAIWSLWRGYLENPSEKRMLARFKEAGVPLELHHVSGHAYVKDLQRLVAALNPGRVVPIHTEEPDRYGSLFPRVEAHPDGEWWEV
jgi:ribonuclease J